MTHDNLAPTTNPNDPVNTTNKSNNNNTMPPPLPIPATLRFGPFAVAHQVFHLSPQRLSYALVNLKPLLPGHVLICPVRVTPRLSQLTPLETSDLFLTVRAVSRMIERVYAADALNVAVQDGVEAGQSVPHVHVHVIPRRRGDMEDKGGGDAVYEMMEGEEGDLGAAFVEMRRRRGEWERTKEAGGREFGGGPDADANRKPRSEEEMRREAEWLGREMEKDAEKEIEVEEQDDSKR